ncbi:MAG TPA: cytochrome P450 [Pseudonocardiaceae bacterium]|nr:cytochrome P450 [Pseudonocardiaceae bacterium]
MIKDYRNFSSEYGTILAVLGGDSAGGRTINLMDPPEHSRIRIPTMKLLSTAAVQRHTARVRDRVRLILKPFLDEGELDVAPLMMRLPMAVIGDIVGVPENEWPDVTQWTMSGVAPEDPMYSLGSVESTLNNAHLELFTLFRDLLRKRAARPKDDIISALLQVEIAGKKLSQDDVILNCYSFVMGANTTTPHVASQLLLALTERPEMWQSLRDGRISVGDAVEEGLRWATPTNHLVRRTTAAVELAGTRIEAGELVCGWVASANRDETVFERPYEFDPTRNPNPHLGFGHGIHYCNGAPGARLVINQVLEELLAGVERFESAGQVIHLRSNFINGITGLPVRTYPERHPGRIKVDMSATDACPIRQ